MPKRWRIEWEEHVTYHTTVIADSEEEAYRIFETGGEFEFEPMSGWTEMASGPYIREA